MTVEVEISLTWYVWHHNLVKIENHAGVAQW